MRVKLMLCTLGALALGPAAFAVTFTGDVATDFAVSGVHVELDGLDDVGLPLNAPVGTISGWDVASTSFVLDRANDRLHVGVDFRGYCGDVDGDGADGITSLWLAANGGLDLPALAQSETACVLFDFDQNGSYELIAGYGSQDGTYRVSTFMGSPYLPGFGFGPLQPLNLGTHAYGPDLELTIEHLATTLEDVNPMLELCFNFMVFGGSFQDDGIGEDFQVGTVCLPPDELVAAEAPTSLNLLSAQPNPFNPGTTLQVELAATGETQLAIYNLQGQLVQSLVNGLLEAGHHSFSFNGESLASGIYLARLATPQGETTTRLLLTK